MLDWLGTFIRGNKRTKCLTCGQRESFPGKWGCGCSGHKKETMPAGKPIRGGNAPSIWERIRQLSGPYNFKKERFPSDPQLPPAMPPVRGGHINESLVSNITKIVSDPQTRLAKPPTQQVVTKPGTIYTSSYLGPGRGYK
jgi:hypothetical protein